MERTMINLDGMLMYVSSSAFKWTTREGAGTNVFDEVLSR
jgi:hypothetical protein